MSASKPVLLVHGAERVDDVPGLASIADDAQFRFASTLDELEQALPGAEIILGWDFKAADIERAWPKADTLRWIQWGGAGVDALMFSALAASDVLVTNAGGIFDRPMAEYTLGVILAHAKRFRETLRYQSESQWKYRLCTNVQGQRALVIGVGSIGREVARLLRAIGLEVKGVGRHARDGDPDFGHVHGIAERCTLMGEADYVVLITPLTEETRNLIGADELHAMKPSGYLINLGRGDLLDEAALVDALNAKALAGAALDVFREEPLPASSPLWMREDVFVSPHMSGDYDGHKADMAKLFLSNFARYRAGESLQSLVNTRLGFVPSVTSS